MGPPWTRRSPDGRQDPGPGSSLWDQGLGLEKTVATAAPAHKPRGLVRKGGVWCNHAHVLNCGIGTAHS